MSRPTHKQVVLARAAVEAAWLVQAQAAARRALHHQAPLVLLPPDGQAIWEAAQALCREDGRVTDWEGADTTFASPPAPDDPPEDD